MVNFYDEFVVCPPNNKPTAELTDVAGKPKLQPLFPFEKKIYLNHQLFDHWKKMLKLF